MVEPEDLLGKADALMARHHPLRTAGEPHAGIPVLEDVVNLSTGTDDLPLLTETVELDLRHEKPSAARTQDMYASLLAALQPEIDRLIEERLKAALEPLVAKLFEDMHGELQSIAHATLSDAVHTAVKRELERRESPD